MTLSFGSDTWLYRGEGNSSIVFSDLKSKQVLRLRKKSKDNREKQETIRKNWLICKEFIDHVMRPLLGEALVVRPKLVNVSSDFVRRANCNSSRDRPKKRKHMEADDDISEAMQMPDFCFIHPWDSSNKNPTFCIELKPKQGFLVPWLKQNCESASLPTVCKFCLLQRMKIKKGTWTHVSKYCPLDIFSGDYHRMHHAIKMLLLTPQNNLRIFKDGNVIFTCLENTEPNLQDYKVLASHLRPHFGCSEEEVEFISATDFVKCKAVSSLADVIINALLNAPNGTRPSLSLSSEVSARDGKEEYCYYSAFKKQENSNEGGEALLPSGCVLHRILQAQRLDKGGIKSVHPMYKKVQSYLSQHPHKRGFISLDGPFTPTYLSEFTQCTAGKKEREGSQPKVESANCGDTDDDIHTCVQRIREFLVAGTSKDCSVMISIQRHSQVSCESDVEKDNHRSEVNKYLRSVKIVDLDPKPSSRIPKYMDLANDMWGNYQKDFQQNDKT